MENGDKAYYRYQGTAVLKDGAPQTETGPWSLIRGTGKLKGLTGKGTYKGTAGADPSRSILRWVDYECAACWIGLRACRKPSFWTTGRSFAVGHWRPGAKNAECDWSLFD